MRTSVCQALALSVGLLATLPAVESVVIGIDFGADWFKVALVKPGNPPIQVVLNEASKRKSPTVVGFDGQERYVGDTALNLGMKKPKQTFSHIKALIGRSYDEAYLAKFGSFYFPFDVVNHTRGVFGLKYDVEGETDDVVFQPEEIYSQILQEAKQMAEALANGVIKDCVITVPSYYSQDEKQAVLDAAELVGLTVLALLPEHTAVALKYGIDGNTDKFDSDRNVIFYDMGALSTKVSLVVFGSEPDKDRKNKTIGNLAVKAVAWDTTLGGAAFTSKLFDILAAASKRPVETARAKAKVWKEAEKVKQVLSANNEFTAMIEGLVDEYDFKHPVTRAGLVAASADLLARVLKPVEHVLKEAEMKPEDIHAVEIVGGGVRIPAVQEALKTFFGKGDLQKGLDGDEAACLGSALYAASLSTAFRLRKFGVKDIATAAISVDVHTPAGSSAGTEDAEGAVEAKPTTRNFKLFKKHQQMPSKKVMTFKKKDDFSFLIKYDDDEYLDQTAAKAIGSFTVQGVAKALKKHENATSTKVNVNFKLNRNGMAEVEKAELEVESVVMVDIEEEKDPKKEKFNPIKFAEIKSKLFVEFNVSVAGLAGDLSTLSGEIVAAAEALDGNTTNDDSKLSYDELIAYALSIPEAFATAMLKRLDANGDEQLDASELKPLPAGIKKVLVTSVRTEVSVSKEDFAAKLRTKDDAELVDELLKLAKTATFTADFINAVEADDGDEKNNNAELSDEELSVYCVGGADKKDKCIDAVFGALDRDDSGELDAKEAPEGFTPKADEKESAAAADPKLSEAAKRFQAHQQLTLKKYRKWDSHLKSLNYSLVDCLVNTDPCFKPTPEEEAAAKEKPKQKEQKRIHRVNLDLVAEDLGVPAMTSTEKAASKKILKAISEKHAALKARSLAYNALEAFIYDTRERVENEKEAILKVATEEQVSALQAELAAAETWLFDESEQATTADFTSKLDKVKAMKDAIYLRIVEAERRPLAVTAARELINRTRWALVEVSTTKPWINDTIKQPAYDALIKYEKWLNESVEKQAGLAVHEAPAFYSKDITAKFESMVEFAVNVAMRMPKPKEKEPKEKDDAKDKKKKKKTSDKDADDAEKADEEKADEEKADEEKGGKAEDAEGAESAGKSDEEGGKSGEGEEGTKAEFSTESSDGEAEAEAGSDKPKAEL